MQASTHILWRVNNEYRKRLSQAETLLNLLEQVLLMQRDDRQEHILAAIAYVREQIDMLMQEHRHWRHKFYYESPETKRMVQDNRSVDQALSRFSRMRSNHDRRLQDIYGLIYGLPRPDPSVTTLPTGDLWTMTQYAIEDLVMFDNYLNEAAQFH